MTDRRPLSSFVVSGLVLALALVALLLVPLSAEDAGSSLGGSELQASCWQRDDSSIADLGFDTLFKPYIVMSCAPAGAKVTKLEVTVSLDHDCSSELNLRLENTVIHSHWLQNGSCPGVGGPQEPRFVLETGHPFVGDSANDTWRLFIRDTCDGCPGALNYWQLEVFYVLPTRTPTPTQKPSPTATATASATRTHSPTASATSPQSPTPTRTSKATPTATTRLPTPTTTATPRQSATPSATPRVSPTPTATREGGGVIFPGGDWPWYAQGEISVHPYPPLAGEPVEVCVELQNTSALPQDVEVQFYWANFGIGIPFAPINGRRQVHLPPHSIVKECIHWIPPVSGHVCVQVDLFVPGSETQRSQRNIDVNEPLRPGEPHTLFFPVGNPLEHRATVSLGLVPHVPPTWIIELSEDLLPDLGPGEVRQVGLTVTLPQGEPLPADGMVVVDVEAFIEGELIGGFRKVFRPPIPLHPFDDPPFAEREISMYPYPPRTGEPAEVCVELRNPTDDPQDVEVQFSWANFGIGIPFTPIDGRRPVHLPPHSIVRECIHWVPPVSGHVCLEVELFAAGYEPQRSQRNIDVNEPLRPGEPHTLLFPVGNPLGHRATVTLGLVPHVPPTWSIELSQDVLNDLGPGEVREVGLTVTPPQGEPLPADGMVVVDVEAYIEGALIGGFRKVFRPPIPLHPYDDPPYAEREITVHPYPPRAGEPTELCVELRNPTDEPQDVEVQFSWANFGIGIPFSPINGRRTVHLPPHSIVNECIHWVAPVGGHVCIQVELFAEGYEPQRSQRNIDVDEPLRPGEPHTLYFPVGNPTQHPATIELGLVPHVPPTWSIELAPKVLHDVQPGEVREVALTVKPPAGEPLPADGTAVVDVEAYIDGKLIGGFRKVFRPPVPVHRPRDPVYAESEIGVDPYPVVPGMPTKLSVELRNPTDTDRVATVTFSIAPFGIGLPFLADHIAPNPIDIFIPAHGAARGHTVWEAPNWRGKFCVQVTIAIDGLTMWSRRNIDVGEPLRPGVAHRLVFPVGIWPHVRPKTVTLGTVVHMPGWKVVLSHETLPSVQPGQTVDVTLEVTPPYSAVLGSGLPIVDVEAFVDGELLGGFRKLDVPPIPLHKLHEKGYAESEISVEPYPPVKGQATTVSATVHNTSDVSTTVNLEFGWADFGMGIPFSSAGMVPVSRSVTLPPGTSQKVSVTWTPTQSGHQCIIVRLTDPDGVYEPQRSQRNVDVSQRPPCGQTIQFTFTIYNDSPLPSTVDLGMITFDVPANWVVTTNPSGSVEIGPHQDLTVTVNVLIPCPGTALAASRVDLIRRLQAESGGVPTIDVEGYIDGELVGGIELRFPEPPPGSHVVVLPVVMR